ncbi:MAG TPA: glycosyltransferase family 2 protein [Planctomycetota bacterium]|nr:glycosyltransferase family 2 protein [Planctomycetota bacterium]
MPTISLVAAAFNEVLNLEALYARVREVMGEERPWELILVDDGSTDGSQELIRKLSERDPRVYGIFFARNCGQTAALATGIKSAKGALIATLDADLQNDPADLPKLEAMLGTNDAVVGYRQKRRDNFLRRVSTKIANGVRNKLTGDTIRDTGCPLKLFRAEAIQSIPFFEGMHRFFPTLLRYHGYTVVECPVSHRPRVAGVSKYGVMNRVFKSLRDLFAVRWMRSRLIRPPIAGTTARKPLGAQAEESPRAIPEPEDGPHESAARF